MNIIDRASRDLVMRRLTRAALAAAIFVVAHSGAARATDFGINYAVIATDTSQVGSCNKNSNATVRQKFVVPRYGDLSVRQTAQAELRAIHQAGFETVRSIVEFSPVPNPSGDLFDTGKIDDSATNIIRNYVLDVRDAGFRRIILGFDMQGVARPACKKTEWGDCFDPSTINNSVAAEAEMIRAASSVKGVALRIDLLNESCVSNALPALLNGNFERFIRAAVSMHAKEFRNIPATVSCQLDRTGTALAATARVFAEGGDHIGFFDIHAYPGPKRNEPAILRQAAESLRGTNVPIIIGETTYGDPAYRNWVTDSFRSVFHADPSEILFWPLHDVSTHCAFDVAQPYSLREALDGHH